MGYYLNVPDNQWAGHCDNDATLSTASCLQLPVCRPEIIPWGAWLPSGFGACTTGAVSEKIFTPSSSSASLLKSPLWYAAKWGGFKDLNDNGIPDLQMEWDKNNDGVPDNYFLVQNPLTLKDSLKSILSAIKSQPGSSGKLSGEAGKSGGRTFKSAYTPGAWSGTVTALDILQAGGGVGGVFWEASEKLPPPAARKIFTRAEEPAIMASTGITFNMTNLETWQKTELGKHLIPQGENEAPESEVAKLVDFLRGSAANEGSTPGSLRERERTLPSQSPLGDSPHNTPYYHAATNTVYVGANDGMLHAFAAADDNKSNAAGGEERFAYIPSQLFSKLDKLADQGYEHEYYVDGEAAVGPEVKGQYYLVGALGRGGKGLYGLDVTTVGGDKPLNANEVVKWEQNGDCAIPDTAATAPQHLGFVLGKPIFFRDTTAATPQLFVAVGNGYNSCAGKAALIILDAKTGKVIQKLAVPDGGSGNGLSTPGTYDNNSDGYPEAIFAGDLKGNLWRFEPDGDNKNGQFKVSGGKPLFVAKNGSGQLQPITTQPVAAKNSINSMGSQADGKVYVFFGTGKFLETSDMATNTNIQTLYAVIDDKAVASTIKRDEMRARQLKETNPGGDWKLSDQTEITSFRYVDPEPTPGDMEGKKGWYVDLDNLDSHLGERIIATVDIQHGGSNNGYALIVPTIMPSDDPCVKGAKSDVLMLSAFTGAPLVEPIVDTNGDGVIDEKDNIDMDGKSVAPASFGIEQAVNDFIIDICDGNVPLVMGSLTPASGTHGVITTNNQPLRSCPPSYSGSRGIKGRISWREIVK
jgi:type IV pilus assembly protein PilY1